MAQEEKEHRQRLRHLEEQIRTAAASLEQPSLSDTERLRLMEEQLEVWGVPCGGGGECLIYFRAVCARRPGPFSTLDKRFPLSGGLCVGQLRVSFGGGGGPRPRDSPRRTET